MPIEVEQKYPVESLESILARLDDLGATACGEVRQIDTYFAHPSRDFAATDEAFRIRQVGEHNVLTYKGPKLDETTKTRAEIELEVAEGDCSVQQAFRLFQSLGFVEVAKVAKTRAKFLLEQDGQPIEMVVDRVDRVGSFVELEIVVPDEKSSDTAALDAARSSLATLAAKLELTDATRRSYLELLLAQSAN